MNLVDTILISLATVAFVIGVHQSFYFGIAASYWIFMISLLIVMFIRYKRAKSKSKEKQVQKDTEAKKQTAKRKR
jgi:uncharacterized membrane protein